MGTLQFESDNGFLHHPLATNTLIGRASHCTLRLVSPVVSAEHASIRWGDSGWELRDLGSSNGTYLDRHRVPPGESRRLHPGSEISFGGTQPNWRFANPEAPEPMLVPVQGGPPRVLQHGLLSLPSSEEPKATIYFDHHGQHWVVESQEISTRLIDGQELEIEGQRYRFMSNEILTMTLSSGPLDSKSVHQAEFVFSVSPNEQHVRVEIVHRNERNDLGIRSQHRTLLQLAKRRLERLSGGRNEEWLERSVLERDLGISSSTLNLEVFRLRRDLADRGFYDAAEIIERRRRPPQLRFRPSSIQIETLHA